MHLANVLCEWHQFAFLFFAIFPWFPPHIPLNHIHFDNLCETTILYDHCLHFINKNFYSVRYSAILTQSSHQEHLQPMEIRLYFYYSPSGRRRLPQVMHLTTLPHGFFDKAIYMWGTFLLQFSHMSSSRSIPFFHHFIHTIPQGEYLHSDSEHGEMSSSVSWSWKTIASKMNNSVFWGYLFRFYHSSRFPKYWETLSGQAENLNIKGTVQ